MANKKPPEDERIHKLGLAKMINQSHGGLVCSVWDIDELPQDWVDFFIAINSDLPQARVRQEKIDRVFNEFEASHLQYGKRQ